jgi:hypothetical protein
MIARKSCVTCGNAFRRASTSVTFAPTMDLHLTDEQAALLVTELDHLIDNDRYPLQEAPMKPYRGPLTTLGNAATAKVRLIVWCRDCQHRVEPDPAEHAARYGAELPVRAWVKRLKCSQCGSRIGVARHMRTYINTQLRHHPAEDA